MGFRVDVTIQGRGRGGVEAVMNWVSNGSELDVVGAVAQALQGAGPDMCGGLDLGHDIVRIDIVPVSE